MAENCRVRPPLSPTVLPTRLPEFVHLIDPAFDLEVEIHHPACELLRQNTTLIFALPAFDRTPDGRPGVHLQTVLAACSVIACNRCGYLTHDATPQSTIENDLAVLPAGRYYYHLAGVPPDTVYTVCPSFAEWSFDGSIIPEDWMAACAPDRLPHPAGAPRRYAESKMTEAVIHRDQVCRLTACGDGVQNAHYVPKLELAWFQANNMRAYNRLLRNPSNPRHLIDDPRNGFLCRSDLHSQLDDRLFTFTCKDGVFVAHFLQTTVTSGQLYHNVSLRLTADASAEFLWARFAWSILPLATIFATLPGTRIGLASGVVATAGDGQLEESQRARQVLHESLIKSSSGSTKKRRVGVPSSQADADADAESPQGDSSSGGGSTSSQSDHFTPNVPANEDSLYPSRADSPQRTMNGDRVREPSISEPFDQPQDFYRFFPHLLRIGEIEWSEDYSWQTAPWYPGMEKAEELKRAWRQRYPPRGTKRRRSKSSDEAPANAA